MGYSENSSVARRKNLLIESTTKTAPAVKVVTMYICTYSMLVYKLTLALGRDVWSFDVYDQTHMK